MKKFSGFTLIELIIFIVVSGVLATTILLSFFVMLQKTPIIHQEMLATQAAKACMEWYIGQRRINGFSSIACNSSVPTLCVAPSGYTTTVACGIYTGDASYEQITVTITGLGATTLNTLIAKY